MKIMTTALVVGLALATPVWAENYDFDGFSKVSAAEGVSVEVTAGEDYSVVGEALRGNIKRLRIRKSGDTLEIDRRPTWGLFNFFRNDKFEVVVMMPEIEAAMASSGSSMTVDAAGMRVFSGDASSGSTLVIENIGGGQVDLESSSGASLSAKGTCDHVTADVSSGASLSASGLICESASVDASSGASLSVFASASVSGEASSGASISVAGNPGESRVETSSGGSVSY